MENVQVLWHSRWRILHWAQRLLLGNHLGHLGTKAAELGTTSSCLKGFWRILLILLNVCGINVFNCSSCCVCGSGPTLGTNIMSLASSVEATAGTQGTQLLKLFIQIY